VTQKTARAVVAAGIALGAIGGAAYVHGAITALRANLRATMPITIASELKIFEKAPRFAEPVAPLGIAKPVIKVVSVRMPVEKKSEVRPSVARDVLETLSRRFQDLAEPELPLIIEAKQDLDDLEEGELDHESLVAVLTGRWVDPDETVHKVVARVAKHHPTRIKASAIQKVVSTPAPLPIPAPAPVIETTLAKPVLVAMNEDHEVGRLSYSELIQTLIPADQTPEVKPEQGKVQMAAGPPVVKPETAPLPPSLEKPMAEEEPIKIVEFPKLRRLGPDPTPAVEKPVQDIRAEQTVEKVDIQSARTEEPVRVDSQEAAAPAPSAVITQEEPKQQSAQGSAGPATPQATTTLAPIIITPPSQAPAPTPVQAPNPQQGAVAYTSGVTPPSTPTPAPAPSVPSAPVMQKGFTPEVFGLDRTETPPPAPSPAVLFSGKVSEAFTAGARAVGNADVQVLGAPLSTRTDDNGAFRFDGVNVQGVLPVVVMKSGFLKRRVDLKPGVAASIELVSENSVGLAAMAAGESAEMGASFVFGELVGAPGETSEGSKIEVAGPNVPTLLYLDQNGIPSRNQKTISSRGQFMLLNVRAGTYLITPIDAFGRERASHILHIGENEGVVRKFSLGTSMIISGHVYNAAAVNAPVDGATVQFLGSEKTVTTSASGAFTLGPVYVDCSELAYLQIEKAGFYRNRVDFACGTGNIDRPIYVFSASYVDGVTIDSGTKISPSSGMVLGHITFKRPVKVQLWGPEELNPGPMGRGKDFYFDNDGVLNGIRSRTNQNGNFTIVDAPDDFSYIQTFDKDNRTLSIWPIFTSSGTVNVYVQ
jgi:hypothetical protein